MVCLKWAFPLAAGMARPESTEGVSGPTVWEAMREQWVSMTGMAGMFVVTIFLGMYIQPFYDNDASRAFGAAGATKAGYILMEFVFILIFTAAVIWLARRGMKNLIKWGILFVLGFAMLYATVPLSYSLLMDPAPTMDLEPDDRSDIWVLAPGEDPSSPFVIDESGGENGTLQLYNTSTGAAIWSHDITREHIASAPPQLMVQADELVLCEGTQWVRIDRATGEHIETLPTNCQLGFSYADPDPDWENCHGQEATQVWAMVDKMFWAVDRYNPENVQVCQDWRYEMPDGFNAAEMLHAEQIDGTHLLLVSKNWAGVVEIPTGGTNDVEAIGAVNVLWSTSPGEGTYTAVTTGTPVGADKTGNLRTIFLGTSAGSLTAWNYTALDAIAADDRVRFDERGAFDAPIRGLLLADCCDGGANDLWVVEGEDLRVYMYGSLYEVSRDTSVPGAERVMMTLHNIENADSPHDDGILGIEQGGSWSTAQFDSNANPADFTVGEVGVYYADLLAFGATFLLMAALIKRPEWYVVNTSGVLVGAGVITILGISFDEWLILLFMVVAAGYDAWAVYRSKHMLELADTMIDLKLPILLVAPQDSSYSFIDDAQPVMQEKVADAPKEEAEAWKEAAKNPPPKRPKQGGDAMFMGLGDVIFPGMLCISAMTWLPDVAGPFGFAAPLVVAFCTMLGGLLGYAVLMTYVAMGRPQAGLPLLNGGAILGYLVSAALFVGSAAFTFNITLF